MGRKPHNALWNTYQAKDKWLVVCAHDDDGNDAWSRLAAALCAEALKSDPRFARSCDRAERAHDLVNALDVIFRHHNAEGWIERLRAKDIACSVIANLEDLGRNDAQAWANNYFMKTHCDEVDREVTIRGMPVTFEKTPGEVQSLGPVLGQDTELILTETLGYTWDDVGTLKAAGAIL